MRLFAATIHIPKRPAISGLSITLYFPFRRIKVTDQQVSAEASLAHIQVQPNERFTPICCGCGGSAAAVHSWTQRKARDLNLAAARVRVTYPYRKLICPLCQGIHIENLELFHSYLRVTRRMVQCVYQLCQYMTVSEVVRHRLRIPDID